MRVQEVLDSNGVSKGWICPVCRSIKSSASQADGCLHGHASESKHDDSELLLD